jgi:uncharacterized Tic20 family protein
MKEQSPESKERFEQAQRKAMLIDGALLSVPLAIGGYFIWRARRKSKERMDQLLKGALKYFGAYLLGMVACVLYCTFLADLPDGIGINGLVELIAATPYAVMGLYFFFATLFTEFFDLIRDQGGVLLLLLLPFMCEGIARRRRSLSFRAWRPLWIGFPLGFLGTLGIYWMAIVSM